MQQIKNQPTFRTHRISKLNVITLQTQVSRATFVFDFGGILQSFKIKKPGRNSHWIETIDAPKRASEITANKWYPSAKLIPFPNRIIDGLYHFGSKKHQLRLNFPSQKHAIHGFVYNKKWNLRRIKIDNDSIELNIGLKLKPQKGYPHNLDINCQYLLRNTKLTCTTSIVNIGKRRAPIGDGWHPYFVANGKKASITFSSRKALQVDTRMIPTGKLLPVSERNAKLTYTDGFSAKQGRLDTCFILSSGKVRLKTKEYTLKLEQDAKYPFLQIFTPPKKHSIAIEPMSCWPDAFNNKKGLVMLAPRKKWKASYSVKMII